MQSGKLLTIPEAKKILKVSTATLNTLMKDGKIKSIRYGMSRRIYEKDLRDYMISLLEWELSLIHI